MVAKSNFGEKTLAVMFSGKCHIKKVSLGLRPSYPRSKAGTSIWVRVRVSERLGLGLASEYPLTGWGP